MGAKKHFQSSILLLQVVILILLSPLSSVQSVCPTSVCGKAPVQPWSLVAAQEGPGVCGGNEAISANTFLLCLRHPSSSVKKERV